MAKPLLPHQLGAALTTAGVFTEDEINQTERIVIVADAGGLVTMHIQRLADERVLDLAALLGRAEIVYAPREAEPEGPTS